MIQIFLTKMKDENENNVDGSKRWRDIGNQLLLHRAGHQGLWKWIFVCEGKYRIYQSPRNILVYNNHPWLIHARKESTLDEIKNFANKTSLSIGHLFKLRGRRTLNFTFVMPKILQYNSIIMFQCSNTLYVFEVCKQNDSQD